MENKKKKPSECRVVMNNELLTSTDYVAVLAVPEGTHLYFSTDALTLGMALKLVSAAFMDAMTHNTVEDQKAIMDMLEGTDIDLKKEV
jgi:hypothetical protein